MRFLRRRRGSTVTDHMGYVKGDYNFDLVNEAAKLYVTVGEKKLNAVKISENVYGFGKHEAGDGGASYDYVPTYTPAEDGTENFRWDINVPVTNPPLCAAALYRQADGSQDCRWHLWNL